MNGYVHKLDRVLDAMGGLYIAQDLITKIHKGEMLGFVVGNSWTVAQVTQYPRARKLQIIAAVGDLEDRDKMHQVWLKYADDNNCGLIQAYGRLGWAPHARELGWRMKAKSYLYQRDM
jgi:hypothetical protein